MSLLRKLDQLLLRPRPPRPCAKLPRNPLPDRTARTRAEILAELAVIAPQRRGRYAGAIGICARGAVDLDLDALLAAER